MIPVVIQIITIGRLTLEAISSKIFPVFCIIGSTMIYIMITSNNTIRNVSIL
ncbi:hypothetical protein D3C81_1279890 [compost metagenome]